MKKRIVALAMVITLLSSVSGYASSEVSLSDIKISILSNDLSISNISDSNIKAIEDRLGCTIDDLKAEKLNDKGKIKTAKNSIELNIALNTYLGDGIYDSTATGTLTIDSNVMDFSIDGNLYAVDTTEGTLLLGGLSGYIDENHSFEDMLTISVNYNISTADSYTTVFWGTYSDTTQPIFLDFGEHFEEINEAIPVFREKLSASQNEYVENMEKDQSIIMEAANPTEYVLAKGTYKLNGYESLYHFYAGNKEAMPTGSYLAKVKALCNISNYAKGYNASLPAFNINTPWVYWTSQNHAVTNVWLNFKTNIANNRIIDPIPLAQSNSISLKWPSFICPYGSVNYVMSYINFSIPVNGVSHSYSGQNLLQTKIWSTDFSEMYITGTPDSAQKGVANNFLVYNSQTAGSSCTATTNASVQIVLEEVDGYSNTKLVFVTVSTPEQTTTLKSVS